MSHSRTESFGRRSSVIILIISLLASFGGPVAPAIAANGTALDLGSAGAYVTFGDPAKLDLAQFTVETWFKRTGTGVASTTGTGGIALLVPLLTHGAAQAEDSNVDANWILGINTAGNVIAADFEAIDDPAPTGQNVPISGTTAITLNVWHHAAASFNGTTWAVYLDGNLEASVTPGLHPRSDSTQGVALGAMLTSPTPFTPTAGRFQGVIDEARVWNVGRTQLEIQGTMNNELTSGTGLVARWGLNEGTSTVVGDSITSPATGTVTGTGSAWVPGFAVPGTPVALADSYTTPQDTVLNVSAPGVLANDTDTGPITAVLVTSVTHGSLTLNADGSFGYTPNTPYVGLDTFTYKANDGSLNSDPVTVSIGVGNSGLDLGSAGAYVTFGDPAKLDLAQFTVETWFKRTGTGVASTTGTGGIALLVPLLTHGAPESDGSNVDANWILGINTAGNVIAADFEGLDDPADPTTGQNAPISGTTAITLNVWHHAAASFNGTTWAVYLDGVLEASSTPGFHPRNDSIQRVALGAMLPSGIVAPTAGRFQGVIDEARVWNVGRTGPQILASKNSELTSGTGLVARWGLNEAGGIGVGDSLATPANGTITGTGFAWVAGFVPPPPPNNAPVAVADSHTTPQDTALNISAPGVLGNDTDADANPLTAVLNATVTNGSLALAADGSFLYTPNGGYSGPDSFTYHANDGLADSNIVTVSIDVTPAPPVNTAPVAVADSYSTSQDSFINVVAPGVLSNDTDADSDPLTALLDTDVTNGSLTLGSDGSFLYTPDGGYNGPDSFTYHANDGTDDSNVVTVSIDVTAAPPTPPTVILNAPSNGATGTSTSPSIAVDVADVNGGTLTVEFWGRTAASGNFILLATNSSVPAGSTTSTTWTSLGAGQRYEWYARVSDGGAPVQSTTWTFNTAPGDPVFVGAGDIASCSLSADEATGALLSGIQGNVWTAGDNVYPQGTTLSMYTSCYEPAWGGSVKARTRPVPGNHDWGTGQVPSGTETLAGYNSYFGPAATDANGQSYYSYDIASSNWHVVNLDSECAEVTGGCSAGSAQELWLRADLAANASKNVIAIWHKPRYSSGVTNLTVLQAFYDDLYEFGVDILLDGHDHIYERLAPAKSGATPSAPPVADATYGIRQFTVGTGGAALQSYSPVLAVSQAGSGSTYGVLKLTLHDTTYDWVFLPIAGQTFTDSGTGSVHGAPSASNNAPVAAADAYGTPLNTALNVTAPGVLTNDTDVDSDPLTAVLNLGVAHGSLTLNADGSFLYTPTSSYSGPDSFTYHANDGTDNSNVVTVSLTVGAPANTGLDLNGTSWVTFGDPAKLDLGQFTIETWFKRTGTGTSNTTGTGGITIVPLLTHGAPEADGSNVDANWILGINTAGNVLAADFEANAGGQNYPISGTTAITNDVWHHAAATYDGANWKLYLDGNLETTTCPVTCSPGVAPRLDSIQHAGLGAMLTSSGAALGRFDGVIDEARVWNVARTGPQILADKNNQLTSGTGLVARWGLNEGTSTVVGDSITSPAAANGSIAGTGSAWVPGFVPPAAGSAPNAPTLNAPANGGTGIALSPTLDVGVSDPNTDPLTVTFFGRPLASGNFAQIAQHTGIASGSNDTAVWANLGAGQTFEWYATVSDGSATTTGPTWTFHTVASTDPVFVGVGDIASCDVTTDTDTGNLIAGIDGVIWTTGDNVYDNGTAAEFATCYEPTPWGSTAVQSRTRPLPGNHDWGVGNTNSLSGYFGYYGANANAGGTSYYSYDIAGSNWHIINLDTECALVGGCNAGSPQEIWLKADLAANASKNIIAAWHRPRYSSGTTNLQTLQPLWDDIYAAGVDILLDGHDHIYERTAPMKSGATLSSPPVADPTFGIRQFTVGTGGEAHHGLVTPLPTSEVRNDTTFGIMKLTLHATSYDWVFLPIAGSTFTDSGTGFVHGAPANTAPVASADSYTTSLNTALNVAAPGVLTNDTDAEGNSLIAVLNTNVLHGSLTLNANGSFVYTPTGGYSGPDSFSYHANDGAANSNVVTVSLTVTTIPAGLVGYWTMDQTSGTSAPDTGLAPANNATTVGGPTWVAGKVGNALRFNGTTQYASTPDEASLDIATAITIAAWVKPEKVGSSNIPQLLVQKATTGATNGYELGLTGATSTAPQKAYIRFNEATNFDAFRVTSTTLYPTDGTTWIHVAGTWDGTTIRFYYNGVQQGTPVAFAGPIGTNTLALGLGGPPVFNAPRLFQGAMDDVRIYNRALSASEISALATPPVTMGLLRVTTNPALPSQISINGVVADSWGLTWLELAPGNYTVHFGHIEGYTEPADQLVTVTAGLTTTLNGNFTQRGSLRVITSPAVPGQISVDAIPRDNWGMWTDIPTGAHQVCFGPVAGYTAPGCQNITVNAGALTTVTGTYTVNPGGLGASGVGLLRVTTNPALPSQISINGVVADSWGLTWLELAPGNYTVHFGHIEGYTEPADQLVTVTAGLTTTLNGNFTQRGSLRVITSPAVPGQISVDAIPRDNWGMWTDIPTGAHQVCFGPVAGHATPSCQNITVNAGALTTVTGTYP